MHQQRWHHRYLSFPLLFFSPPCLSFISSPPLFICIHLFWLIICAVSLLITSFFHLLSNDLGGWFDPHTSFSLPPPVDLSVSPYSRLSATISLSPTTLLSSSFLFVSLCLFLLLLILITFYVFFFQSDLFILFLTFPSFFCTRSPGCCSPVSHFPFSDPLSLPMSCHLLYLCDFHRDTSVEAPHRATQVTKNWKGTKVMN